MINHLLLSSLARVDAGSGVLSALFVLLLLLGHVNGDGDRDATDKREATRVGPSDETWVGFDTLSSSPCLRTSKKASVTLCLFGGRVLHMDGTPNLEPWFLPASQEWRSKVTTPVGFGVSKRGWLREVRSREVRNLADKLARAREATDAAKQQAAEAADGDAAASAAKQQAVGDAEARERVAFAAWTCAAAPLADEQVAQGLPDVGPVAGDHDDGYAATGTGMLAPQIDEPPAELSIRGFDIFPRALVSSGGLQQAVSRQAFGMFADNYVSGMPRSMVAVAELRGSDLVIIDPWRRQRARRTMRSRLWCSGVVAGLLQTGARVLESTDLPVCARETTRAADGQCERLEL